MLPITIVWPEQNDTYYANAQSYHSGIDLILNNLIQNNDSFVLSGTAFSGSLPYVNNLPLIFNNAGTGVPNINIGSNIPYVLGPPNTQRTLFFRRIGGSGSLTLVVVGSDQYGSSLQENVVMAPNSSITSVFAYTKILFIIPSITSNIGETIQVGLGYTGYTIAPLLDVYNKTSRYTVSYTNVMGTTTGTQVTPYFTTEPVVRFIDRQQVYTQFTPENSFVFPITNANVVCTTTSGSAAIPFVIPIGHTASLSTSDIPLTSIYTAVNGDASYDAGFTQTIIQQGGHY